MQESETTKTLVLDGIKKRASPKKHTKKYKQRQRARDRKLDRAVKVEQCSKTTAIKKAAFERQVRLALSLHTKEGKVPLRISPKAMSALQEACEQHLVQRFGDALAIANRHGMMTPTDVDLRLVCSLKPVLGTNGKC